MNKRKVLEAARKYAQKGQKDRALKEYEKLLKLDPRDAKLRLEIGDAHRRWGQVEEAVATYSKVAEQYTAEGFDARAVAVYKQIQNLDPERWSVYEPLADLYQRMGLTSEAVQMVQAAADGYHRAGERRQALDLLRKMAALDPSNTTSRLKVAELLRQDGLNEEAIAEYDGIVEELSRQGEADQAASVLEKVLEVEPDRTASLRELARNLIARGLGQRAEPHARRALDLDPEETEHYELLAEAFRLQRRDEELADVYRRLAELYRQRGDQDRAREITQRFAPPEGLSADTDPRFEAAGPGQDEGLAGDVSHMLLDDEAPSSLASENLEPLEPLEIDPEPSPVEPPAPEAPAAEPPSGDPEQLLAEANVYLRYGKRSQAIANLEAILARDAEHRPALEKLGEACAETDETERAVELWLRAARIASEQGDHAQLAVLRDRIAALDQAAAATLGDVTEATPEPEEDFLEISHPVAPSGPDAFADESEALTSAQPAPPSAATTPVTEVDFDDIEIDIETDGFDAAAPPEPESEPFEEAAEPAAPEIDDLEIDVDLDDEPELEGAGASPAQEGPSAPSASVSTSQQVHEEIEEAEFYLQQGLLDEAEAIYQRLAKVAPNHPQVMVRLGEIAAARGEGPGSGDRPDPTPEPVSPESEAAAGGSADEWTDDGLSDTDTFGAPPAEASPEPSEAPEPETIADPEPAPAPAPEPVEPLAADNTASRPSIPELEPSDTGALPPVPDEMARELEMPSGGAGFDLAAELSEVLDDDSKGASATFSGAEGDSFAAVFREFKKGVSKTLSEGDHETHYDLGIAYREMGLLDDALGEFRIACESPTRRVDCLQMMAQCLLELGKAEEAAEQLRQALASEGLDEGARLSLHFDLGCAFESLGDVEAARSAWEAVVACDPSFQGVEERLAALETGPKPEEDTDTVESGEDFESFDDFLADVEDDEAEAAEAAAPEAPGVDFDDLVAEANEEGEPDPEPEAAAEPPEAHQSLEPEREEPVDEGPEPGPAAPSEDSPGPDRKGGPRRKKKISFV